MDISWKWLNFFMDDDDELKRIGDAYGAGEMLSGEIKCELIACLTPIDRRAPGGEERGDGRARGPVLQHRAEGFPRDVR